MSFVVLLSHFTLTRTMSNSSACRCIIYQIKIWYIYQLHRFRPLFSGYHRMILVSHSYRVTDISITPFRHRIAPFRHHIALVSSQRHSYRTLQTSYRTRSSRAIWCRKGAIRCTEGCETSVSDSIRVWSKNHAMMFYLSLNCSVAVLSKKYRIFKIKLFLVDVILIIIFVTLWKFSRILRCLLPNLYMIYQGIKNCLELILFSCVVQFSLKVTITKLLIILHNLKGKCIKM